LVFLALSGCSVFTPAPRPGVYDFGPGAVTPLPANRMANLPPLAFAGVQAASALDSTAVLYRLNYSDAQQLRPYTQARWSMPPAEMLRQRMREQLGQRRAVLNPADGVVAPTAPLTLRVELDEFSHIFVSPSTSFGLVRLRATLGRGGPGVAGREQLVAQHSFVVQRPSSTADAPGGVRALSEAVDALIVELDTWVQQSGGGV
jgi:cholesterol transport system auxiliary component